MCFECVSEVKQRPKKIIWVLVKRSETEEPVKFRPAQQIALQSSNLSAARFVGPGSPGREELSGSCNDLKKDNKIPTAQL